MERTRHLLPCGPCPGPTAPPSTGCARSPSTCAPVPQRTGGGRGRIHRCRPLLRALRVPGLLDPAGRAPPHRPPAARRLLLPAGAAAAPGRGRRRHRHRRGLPPDGPGHPAPAWSATRRPRALLRELAFRVSRTTTSAADVDESRSCTSGRCRSRSSSTSFFPLLLVGLFRPRTAWAPIVAVAASCSCVALGRRPARAWTTRPEPRLLRHRRPALPAARRGRWWRWRAAAPRCTISRIGCRQLPSPRPTTSMDMLIQAARSSTSQRERQRNSPCAITAGRRSRSSRRMRPVREMRRCPAPMLPRPYPVRHHLAQPGLGRRGPWTICMYCGSSMMPPNIAMPMIDVWSADRDPGRADPEVPQRDQRGLSPYRPLGPRARTRRSPTSRRRRTP